MSILHQNATLHSLGSAATHPPHVKSIGWTVLDIIKMQTDTQRFLPLLERRICSAPPSEASNMVFGSALLHSEEQIMRRTIFYIFYNTYDIKWSLGCNVFQVHCSSAGGDHIWEGNGHLFCLRSDGQRENSCKQMTSHYRNRSSQRMLYLS